LQPVEPGPKEITITAIDATVFVAKDTSYAGWTWDGTIPGPVHRVVQGDEVTVTVRNDGAFHVVGAIFDKAYVNANPANLLQGLQGITIGPGDGACVEFTLEEPGEYIAVNHAFVHASHGAIAIIHAE
jgi:FtsP/CotA-like multicopper oxidase with cupredoxin domain